MRRIALCLLIALASAGVAARESKLSAADDSGACSTHSSRLQDRDEVRDAAPVSPAPNKAKVTPRSGGGDSDIPVGRVPSPRWHRFLPGMFR